jgi:carboxymethylenebutenolidase
VFDQFAPSSSYPSCIGSIIKFDINGQSGEGYISLPKSGSGPAVIVIQEWWGLVGHIKDVVDRFAAAGFVAFAPDLYHGQATTEPDTAKKLMMELELTSAGKEMSNAASYLLSVPETSSSSVGVVGFCMGGSLAIWSATLTSDISTAIGFYPGASWERHAPKWSEFKGKHAMIHCAESDGTSTAPGIQEAKKNIESAGGEIHVFDYPGTKHAFFNDDRPEVFDENAAEIAWSRTLVYLNSSLYQSDS